MDKHPFEWPQGFKRTKPRLQVLEVLERAQRPLSVATIAERMQADGRTNWFSTVYRVLQAFLDHDMVVETSVAGSDVRTYELKREHHHHYVTCVRCHKLEPLPHCPMDAILEQVRDFEILDHRIEISGICKDCQDA